MKNKFPIIFRTAIVVIMVLGILVLIGLLTQNDLLRPDVPASMNMRFDIAAGFISLCIILLGILFAVFNKIFIREKAKGASPAEKLITGDEQFRDMLDNMLEGVQIHDFNWRYIYVNATAVNYSSYSKEELLGYTIMEKYPGIEQKNLFKVMQRCMNERVSEQLQTEFIFPDGTKADYELSIQPVPEGIFILSIDITERKRIQEELIQSEQKYHTIFLKSPLPKWVYDSETLRFLDVNEAAIRHYGYTREEFLTMTLKDIRPKETLQPFLDDILRIPGDSDYRQGTWNHLKKNGELITVETTAHSIEYSNSKARLVIINDITKRKKAEENLMQSEVRLNEAQAIAQISNWEIDLAQNTMTCSDEFYRIYGVSKAEVKPSTELFLSCMHPDDRPFAEKKVQETLDLRQDSSFDFRFVRRDGIVRHGHTEWRFEFDQKGNPVRLFGIVQDITETKEAEQNLILLEQKILEQKIEEQKKIARAIITGQEKERNYIGQELHDNINQILAGTKMFLSVAGKKNDTVKELVKYPMELIDTSIEEIRFLCSKLVTPYKNIDLEELIRDLLGRLDQHKTTKTEFNYKVPDELLTDDLKLNIYRIIQEMVNNIQKYADATNVSTSVKIENKAICITVEDDGKGFNVSSKRNGIGISNIINRAETFNGKVQIKSSAGNGCKTIVTIPVNYN